MYKPKSFDLLRNSPDMLINLCEGIYELMKEEFVKEMEFSGIPNMNQRKEEILKLLDHLEPGEHMFDNRSSIQEGIILFITTTIIETSLHYPNKKETEKLKKHYKQKYELDDTIGYVHVHKEKLGPK